MSSLHSYACLLYVCVRGIPPSWVFLLPPYWVDIGRCRYDDCPRAFKRNINRAIKHVRDCLRVLYPCAHGCERVQRAPVVVLFFLEDFVFSDSPHIYAIFRVCHVLYLPSCLFHNGNTPYTSVVYNTFDENPSIQPLLSQKSNDSKLLEPSN